MGEGIAARGRVRLTLVLFLLFSPCLARTGDQSAKPVVIASLFPQYDFARRIAGDRAIVTLLLPPGAESHSYEPTPTDMKTIASATLFVYTGPAMEPWAKRIADATARPGGVTVVDASRGISFRRQDAHDLHSHGDGEEHGDHEHRDRDHGISDNHFHEYDPHIWLDPILSMIMVDNIRSALEKADPPNAPYYRKNAAVLRGEINDLDTYFREKLETAPGRVLVFGERFAFAYFFNRYDLREVGAYDSCAPGSEPGMRAVMDTVKYVKDHGVRVIYLEAMSTSRISSVIQKETGAEILPVDSLHNPPAARQATGAGYVDIMRENMDAFLRGLE